MRFWRVLAKEPFAADIGQLRGHWNEVWAVHYSPDGQRLITGGKDGKVKLWKGRPPARRVIELPETTEARHRGFSEDSAFFRTRLGEKLQFWDVKEGRL